MRKQRKPKLMDNIVHFNPVAKYAQIFNKAQVHADNRQYQRRAKHQGLEPFSIIFA